MRLLVQPHYSLPPTIKSIQTGWQQTFSSAATVSALLAAVEAQLFVFIKGEFKPGSDSETSDGQALDPHSSVGQALMLFTYLTFLCSMSATVSSLLLTDEIGELEIRASNYYKEAKDHQIGNPGSPRRYSQTPNPDPHTYDDAVFIDKDTLSIMVSYGLHSWLKAFIGHWAFMLTLGYLSLLIQILIYVWMTETRLIRYSVLALTCFMLGPLLSFLGHTVASHKRVQNYAPGPVSILDWAHGNDEGKENEESRRLRQSTDGV